MSTISRIGVSLETDLLKDFDRLIARKGFAIRSDAIREMIRQSLSEERIESPSSNAVAAIFLVYDHHTSGLTRKLNEMQHNQFYHVLASTHIHLDHHNCLETIFLKGKAGEIKKLADKLSTVRGVKLSRVNLVGLVD
ncbi:MAG: nickel-responsive transcriptional regulator NikR [Phycisphaerae bacterium]|nr:nickel-responsive transcriptional regulator NikR [Phycisphaerae bacterium]